MTRPAGAVAASEEITATRSSPRKVAIPAEVLHALDRAEVLTVAGLRSGVPRQTEQLCSHG